MGVISDSWNSTPVASFRHIESPAGMKTPPICPWTPVSGGEGYGRRQVLDQAVDSGISSVSVAATSALC